jgi:hypothetical protein
MALKYPNKDESTAITEALVAVGATSPGAKAAAFEAFANSEFGLDNAESYFVVQGAKQPDVYFPKIEAPLPVDDARAAELAEMERASFEGKGNVDARGRLVKTIGQDATEARAKAWGLRGVHDFRTPGIAPAIDEAGAKPKAKPTDNPFTKARWNLTEQSRLYRATPELAVKLAAAAGVSIGATRPIK